MRPFSDSNPAKKLQIKLIDFGYAQSSEDVDQRFKMIGTRLYMAPELFDEARELTLDDLKAVDIWASGVLAYYLFSAGEEFPFDSADEETEENFAEI